MQNVGRHPRPHDFFNAHSNSLKLKSAARASATENDSMYSQRTYQEYHSCSGAILLGSASSFDVHPAMSMGGVSKIWKINIFVYTADK